MPPHCPWNIAFYFFQSTPETGRSPCPSHTVEFSMDTKGIDTSQWIQHNIPGADRYRDAFGPCVGGKELHVADTTTQFRLIGYIQGIGTKE